MKKRINHIIIILIASIFTIVASGFNLYVHQCSHAETKTSGFVKDDTKCESQCIDHSCCHINNIDDSPEAKENGVSYHCCSDLHKYFSLNDFFIQTKHFISWNIHKAFNKISYCNIVYKVLPEKCIIIKPPPPESFSSIQSFTSCFLI